MTAHPSYLARRRSNHESEIRNVLGNNCSRCHERVATDGYSGNNRRIGANCASPLQMGQFVEVMPAYLGARISYVRQYTGRAEKDIIINFHTGIDRNIVLDLDVIANHGATVDIDVLANNRMLPDTGPFHHVSKMPDFCSSSDLGTLINIGGFVREVSGLWILYNRIG